VAEEQVTVMASHIPAPASGSAAKIASPAYGRERRWRIIPVEPDEQHS